MNPRRRRRLQRTHRHRRADERRAASHRLLMRLMWWFSGGVFLGMPIDMSLPQTGPIFPPTDEEFARYAGPPNEGTP